jgi:hypothetical protein
VSPRLRAVSSYECAHAAVQPLFPGPRARTSATGLVAASTPAQLCGWAWESSTSRPWMTYDSAFKMSGHVEP